MNEKLTSIINKIDNFIEKIGRFNYWLTFIMVIISAYNAIGRYFGKYLQIEITNNALIELQWYSFSIIFLLGAAYGLKHNAHVKVDVIYNLLSDKTRTYINIFGTIFFLIPFCIISIIVSFPAVINSWKVLEMSPDPGGLPRYPLKTLILLLIEGISFLLKNILHLKIGFLIKEEEQITEKVI